MGWSGWASTILSFKLQLHWLVNLLLVHNGVAAVFIVGSLYRSRKVVGIGAYVVGNVSAVSVSFAHEHLMLRVDSADSLTLGTFAWAFFVYEFIYYWIHRISHKVSFVWYLVHFNHHRSKSFGLHMATFASLGHKFLCYSLNIWLTCVVTGIPIIWAFYIGAASFGLTFFCHSLTLARISLGPLEYLLMTPAAHAVHHASNKDLLDKNFGGLVLLWDHVFKSFVHGPTAMKRPDLEFGVFVEPLKKPSAFAYCFGGEMVLWHKLRQWRRGLS